MALRDRVIPRHDQYCPLCHAIIGPASIPHCDAAHDGRRDIEMYQLLQTDEGLIAKPRDRGHIHPHTWLPIDGHQQCPDCSAIQLTADDDALTIRHGRDA